MKKILTAAIAAGILVAGCGDSASNATPEDQVRTATTEFFGSIDRGDGKCLEYIAKEAMPMMKELGCDTLEEAWKETSDDFGDFSKAKVTVKGERATLIDPADDTPYTLVREDGDWKMALDA